MTLKCKEIIKIFEKKANPTYAENWDNIGLQIGDPEATVNKIMVSLDVNALVVDKAINENVDLLIVHHTPIFQPLSAIRYDSPKGQIVTKLIKNDINLYCAHTNLDSCPGGVNDSLAELFDLKDIEVLEGKSEKLMKLVVYVPKGHLENVRSAICEKGAGFIGNYSHTTFQTEGTGTFLPLEGAKPFIGEEGKLEKVDECRLETILPVSKVKEVVASMLLAHPYEEVAYDLYELQNKGEEIGLGRVGYLKEEMKLIDLVKEAKKVLNIDNLRFVGNPEWKVKKVALCGGSGASLIGKAIQKGADVFITGDLKYHEAQDAENLGLALIDAGHFGTEVPVVKVVAKYLQENIDGIDIITADINTNPFKYF